MLKIVNVNSGLGNQMFQFAFYLALKDRFNSSRVMLDTSWFNDESFHNGFELERVFGIDAEYATLSDIKQVTVSGYSFLSRIKRRFLSFRKGEIIEPEDKQCEFHPDLFGTKNVGSFYRGYWQSYKYFENLKDSVVQTFEFPPIAAEDYNNRCIIDLIRCNPNRVVSIHIRRGDYIKHSRLRGICNMDYYSNAIRLIESQLEHPLYIIFSDDIDWCRDNFNMGDMFFVDWNLGDKSYIDMQLMSLCHHNITANSSFSWWGAYLNRNDAKTVIAPRRWMVGIESKDLLPLTWISV